MKLSVKPLWMLVTVTLAGCNQTPSTLEDTEGRVFSVKCEGEACALTQTDGRKAKLGRPRLHTTGHVVSVCDVAGVRTTPAPDACRPIVCGEDRDCPALDGGKGQATCSRGLCINPGEKLRVVDAVTLCLAGTGLGRRTAKQAERYALGLNCGKPCVVPAACRQLSFPPVHGHPRKRDNARGVSHVIKEEKAATVEAKVHA